MAATAALSRTVALPLTVLLLLCSAYALLLYAPATASAHPARPHPAPAPPGADRAWPVSGPSGSRPVVVRPWDPPPSPWAAGHRGVDLAAPTGAAVRAAAPGRVSFVGTVAGRGVLSVELAGTGDPPLRTTYEPVRPTARKGDRVTAGQPVARLATGPYHCPRACLHWGLLRGKQYLDPLSLLPSSLLRTGPSRLLPVFGVPEPRPEPRARPQPFPDAAQAPAPAAHAAAHHVPPSTLTALACTAALAVAAVWSIGRLRGSPRSR